MTDVTPTRCPACGGKLEAADGRWRLASCDGCGGVWADAAATAHVLDGLGKKFAAYSDEAARDAEGERPRDASRPCPVCGLPLEPSRRMWTNLDACAEHGTWFDRGELRRVALQAGAGGSTAEEDKLPHGREADVHAEPDEIGTAIAGAATEAAVTVGLEIVFGLISSALSSNDD